MKTVTWGIVAAVTFVLAGAALTTGASATGSRLMATPNSAPKTTLLSRSYRWRWDPFRVDGNRAYAVAWITNNHHYALTLKVYCRNGNDLIRSLSGRHLIAPGQTFRWDTRKLADQAGGGDKAVVNCQFWVDGSIDLRGQIVNRVPARMGLNGSPYSVVTFNYANFAPEKKG